MKGYVYVISNSAMPNYIKVGFSTKDPASRAQELGTGSPFSYQVEYEVLVDDPHAVEKEVHQTLSFTNAGKEWFTCNTDIAIQAIKFSCKNRTIYYERLLTTSEKVSINSDTTVPKPTKEPTQPIETIKPPKKPKAIKKEAVTQAPKTQQDPLPLEQTQFDETLTLPQLIEQAEKGNPQAQYELGFRYDKGIGTRIKLKESFEWYLKSARQGNEDAMLATALAYLKGRGTEQSNINDTECKAVEFLCPLVKNENPIAQHKLSEWCYFRIEDNDVNKAVEQLVKFGINIKQEQLTHYRLELLEASAAKNYTPAISSLASHYSLLAYEAEKSDATGKLSKALYEKSFQYNKKAAENGDDARAMRGLADAYFYGYKCKKNIKLAKEWMQKSANAGDRLAAQKLKDW
jgi:TPR repeat protein